MGKRSRASGMAWERKVRQDLEWRGYIVAKWMNNVGLDKKDGAQKLMPSKHKFRGMGIPMSISTGFPDFIAYKPFEVGRILGIESKMNGILDKKEKETCKWLLSQGIFNKILVAKKQKKGRRIIVIYRDIYGVELKNGE